MKIKAHARAALFLALLVPCFAAFSQQAAAQAQEKKIAVAVGPEWNMNSGENFALGFVVGADYNLPTEAASFATGLSMSVNINGAGVALEPAALYRWYFFGSRHTKFFEQTGGSTFRGAFSKSYDGFFVQADAGVTLIVEDGDTTALVLGGARVGCRLPMGPGFYIEPFGRLGYPFMFGIGASAGLKF